MSEPKPSPKPRSKWVKRTWAIVRPLWIPVVFLLAVWIGMVGGYVYLGKQPLAEVWSLQTWKHLFDLVF